MEKREFDIFELIKILLRHRWFIIIFVGIVSVAAVIYSLVTPKIWKSEATFYIVGDDNASLPINLPGLGSLASTIMKQDKLQGSISAVSALRSRRFSEDVIRKFDLIRYFKISDRDSLLRMDVALKKLKKAVKVSLSEKAGLISISVETKDKKLSMDMINYYLAKLEEYNRDQKLTKGKRERIFLEERVKETRAVLDSLIAADKEFRSSSNAIDIEEQAAVLIKSYAELVATKMAADIELEMARESLSESSPVVQELKVKRDALNAQIREMESSKGSVKPRYLIDISSLPDLGSRYAQIKMELLIQTKVFEFLYPQYEAARLEELKDMPTVDILDSPREAGLRSRPKRAMICVIAAFMAFVVAVIVVLFKSILERNKDRLLELRQVS
ncbi:MAG TPA: Wzz/FepE/Etk N-terminal domain-containing protein [Candidatus Cloacimonadota bacterium]|nr:Wzz/FepE/Etk N-terminal domain-containing protein [Candidatus Cloacimonadota bacterium]